MPMDAYRSDFAVRRAAVFSRALVVFSLSLAMMVAGCKKQPATDDASLNTQVQSKLAADQNLSGQSIQSSVTGGVVTLSGNVTSDTARTIAAGDVGQIAGVKTVVDNLVVQPVAQAPAVVSAPPEPATVMQPASPTSGAKARKPAPVVAAAPMPPPPAPAQVVRNSPAPAPAVAPPPPPPPAPVVHNVILPAGTVIPVTLTQTLSSATAKAGDRFSGVISDSVRIDGMVALAQGTPVTGRVDEAQDAAHFKGSSLLSVSLSAIDRKGAHIEVSTESYSKKGAGRGKNTAEKVGGGAAVGAILGGIFGGGKGAAIGAAAGGGVGAGANAATRGEQVEIPSESVLRFRLLDPITVRVTAGSAGNESSSLERRSE